jgi:hypothetical protein
MCVLTRGGGEIGSDAFKSHEQRIELPGFACYFCSES